jgi:proteasome lid subunit RPN8/RPN11
MLVIKKTDLHAIVEQCNTEFPNEACGILAGKGGTVEKVYRMTNARPSPVNYEMDPAEQFRVMKDIRREGLDLAGIYHSHPGGRAYPSGVDVERAYWPGTLFPNFPGAVYVIVSLTDRQDPAIKGFTIVEGAVNEVTLTVT